MKIARQVSLTEKLILNFLLIGISAIVILGIYSYRSARNILQQKTYEHLCTVREIKKHQIDQYYSDRFRDITSIRKSTEIQLFIDNKSLTSSISPKELATGFMLNYLSSCGYYKKLYIVAPDSSYTVYHMDCEHSEPEITSHTASPDISECLRMGKKNGLPEFISDLISTGNNSYSQFVCGIIPDKAGKSMGYVMLEIPGSFIDSLMLKESDINEVNKSEEAYIIGADYVMRSCSRFDSLSVRRLQIKNNSTPDIFRLQQGIANYTDYRGRSVLSAFTTIETPGLNWAVLVEQDTREAMLQVSELYNQSLILIILISAAFFMFVYFTSRRIVKPIINLRNAAAKIGEGNFETELPVVTHDEIGELTETFNRMALKLKLQQTEIGKERFRRLRAMIDSQELERQRLSKELHEGIGQTLVALRFKTESIKGKQGQEILHEISDIEMLSDGIIEQIRQISNNLAPMVLGEFGLASAIRFLADELSTQSGIKITLETQNLPAKIRGKVRTYLFRIVQESLINATKHSGAQWIKVDLSGTGDSLKLIMSDNGKGFSANDSKTFGHGLHNIKERVELLRGRIKIEAESGEGTTISIVIPYTESENGKN
jgi:signal transduction histidine kinase